MHISDEGLVAGSVNRAELAAAYANATDKTVRANLAAVGAENGMYVSGGKLVDPSEDRPEGTMLVVTPDEVRAAEQLEPEPEAEPVGKPAQAEPKAAWIDWAVSQGLDPEEAEAATKAELIEWYGG